MARIIHDVAGIAEGQLVGWNPNGQGGAGALEPRTHYRFPGADSRLIFPNPTADPLIGDYTFKHEITPFDPGFPDDHTMQLGYNVNRPLNTETAIFFQLEGSYTPYPDGTTFTEAHLCFEDATGLHYRPWSWRIQKDSLASVVALFWSAQCQWTNSVTGDVMLSFSPEVLSLINDNENEFRIYHPNTGSGAVLTDEASIQLDAPTVTLPHFSINPGYIECDVQLQIGGNLLARASGDWNGLFYSGGNTTDPFQLYTSGGAYGSSYAVVGIGGSTSQYAGIYMDSRSGVPPFRFAVHAPNAGGIFDALQILDTGFVLIGRGLNFLGQNVTLGANDSGGSGKRALVVPNA